MAGPYNPPKKNEAFEFTVGLQDIANPGLFKSSPTVAAGDAKVDLDGAGLTNLGTAITVTPAATKCVRVQLSSDEMNADKVTVVISDQTSPPEWADLIICILTTA